MFKQQLLHTLDILRIFESDLPELNIETVYHQHRVACFVLAAVLPLRQQHPADRISTTEIAGLILGAKHHDSEKGHPDIFPRILSPGILTTADRHIINQHPALSGHRFQSAGAPPCMYLFARWHHYRPDGQGYPTDLDLQELDNLSPIARTIILGGQTLDVIDAILSIRDYRANDPNPSATLHTELQSHCGTKYDHTITNLILSHFELFIFLHFSLYSLHRPLELAQTRTKFLQNVSVHLWADNEIGHTTKIAETLKYAEVDKQTEWKHFLDNVFLIFSHV